MIELGLHELGKEEESVEGPKDNRKGQEGLPGRLCRSAGAVGQARIGKIGRRSERGRLPRHYGFFSRMGMELLLVQ